MENKNLILFICAVLSFFAVFAVNSVMVVIPTIAAEFHMNNIVQNWAIIIFLLVVAVLSVPAGQISGKYGLKKVTIISVVLFILISIANVLVTSSEQFLLCRLILGISLSFFNVTSMAMVVSAFRPEERGKALGITITGVYIALSLAPVLGGILNYHLGWRSVVLFGVPFLLVILALLFTKVDEEWITFGGIPLDVKGSVAYGIGMVLFIYGFTILNTSLGVILTVLGVIVLIIFGLIELREAHPVFDIRFFKNRKFLSANFASLCAYLATFAVTTILNYHSLLLFSFLNEATSIEFLIVSMIIYGIGFGLFSPPNTNVIMSSVPPKDTSVASAAVATMRTVGQAMSLGILTLVFAFVMGNVPIVEQYYPLLISSCQITCIICMVLCVASVFASLVGIKSEDSAES